MTEETESILPQSSRVSPSDIVSMKKKNLAFTKNKVNFEESSNKTSIKK